MHRREALGHAQWTLLGALPPAPQHLLDLTSGLPDDAVFVRLFYLGKTGTQKFFKLVYGLVFEFPTLLLVVTLISEIAKENKILNEEAELVDKHEIIIKHVFNNYFESVFFMNVIIR